MIREEVSVDELLGVIAKIESLPGAMGCQKV